MIKYVIYPLADLLVKCISPSISVYRRHFRGIIDNQVQNDVKLQWNIDPEMPYLVQPFPNNNINFKASSKTSKHLVWVNYKSLKSVQLTALDAKTDAPLLIDGKEGLSVNLLPRKPNAFPTYVITAAGM